MSEDNQKEMPGFLKDVIKKVGSGPPPSPEAFEYSGPVNVAERTLTPQRLSGVLFSEPVQEAFAELAKDTEKISGIERLAEELEIPSALEMDHLKERTFVVYGENDDPDAIEVSNVEAGETRRVRSTYIPTSGDSFEIFDVHSEPGHVPGEVVLPSGLSEESGDLWSLTAITGWYEDQKLTVRPIMVVVRPDSKQAMFVQVAKPSGEVEEAIRKQFSSPQIFETQQEVDKVFEDCGLRVATVEFPLKETQVSKALEEQGFELEVRWQDKAED